MKVSETLNRAADLIQERGWTKGPNGWPGVIEEGAQVGGPLCLEGGIYAALGAEYYGAPWVRSCPAYTAVNEYLGRHKYSDLWPWNDFSAQSAEDVIGVLRAAAVIEEAKEKREVAA